MSHPRPRVFVTRRLPGDALNRLTEVAVEIWPDALPPTAEVLRQRAAGTAGLLCLLTDQVDAVLLDAAGPGLRVISQMAVGVDNIDVTAATARRIPVGHTPGVLTEATADLAWALLMAAARRVVEADRYVRAGQWRTWHPGVLLGADVSGATLGIVGLGRIGAAVAQRARGFAMRVLYANLSGPLPELESSLGVEYAALPDLLAQSDFVSLHVPLTAHTRHLIDGAALRRMRRGAILVNTARGGVVDQAALAQALAEGRLAAAALDVTDPEPLPPDSPLLGLPNLILVPHIGSASLSARTRMAQMAVDNLLAGLRGQRLPHCFNPEVYG